MIKLKKIIYMLAVMMLLSGCTMADEFDKSNSNNQLFEKITSYDVYENGCNLNYTIVYANDTKVKYLIVYGYRRYAITPLYNADGTLQTYGGIK